MNAPPDFVQWVLRENAADTCEYLLAMGIPEGDFVEFIDHPGKARLIVHAGRPVLLILPAMIAEDALLASYIHVEIPPAFEVEYLNH